MRFVGLIVLFAVGVGLIVWLTRPVAAPPPSGSVSLQAVPPTMAPEEPAAPEVVAPVATDAKMDSVLAPRIVGTVVLDQSGVAVAGAVVSLWNARERSEEQKAVSDESGAFSFTDAMAGEYDLWVEFETYHPEMDALSFNVPEDEPAEPMEIRLVQGGVVTGRVYDSATGEGIPGVRVRVPSDSRHATETDNTGVYRIKGLLPGPVRIVRDRVKGYIFDRSEEERLRFEIETSEVVGNADFPLTPGVFGTVSGRVVHQDGEPAAGATVSVVGRDIMQWSRPTTGESAKDGSFLVDDIEIDSGMWVVAKAEGYTSAQVGPLTVGAEGVAGVVVTLVPVASIRGVVVDLDGAPIRDSHRWTGSEENLYVETSTLRYGRNSIGLYGGHIADDGTFELSGLPPGRYGLGALRDNGLSGFFVPALEVAMENGESVEGIELAYDLEQLVRVSEAAEEGPSPSDSDEPRKFEIVGYVVSALTGEPVSRYELRTKAYLAYGQTFQRHSISDEYGRFAITEKEGTSIDLEVWAEGFSSSVTSVPLEEQEVTIRLEPGVEVSGTVVNGRGEAVSGASIFSGLDIRLHESRDFEHPERDAVSLEDGSFVVGPLRVEPVKIFAEHPAYATGFADVSPGVTGASGVVVRLHDGGAIEGVVSVEGQPSAGRAMMVLDEEWRNVAIDSTHTDAEGRYRIERLPAGLYTVYTAINGARRTVYRDAEVEDGLTTTVDLEFSSHGGVVYGTATLDGKAPRGVNVNVQARTPYGRESILPLDMREGGDYRIEGVPAGEVTLHVHAIADDGARRSAVVEFTLGEGEVVERNVAVVGEAR